MLEDWKKANLSSTTKQRANKSDLRVPSKDEITAHLHLLRKKKIVMPGKAPELWAPNEFGRILFRALNADGPFPIFQEGFDEEGSERNWKVEFLVRVLWQWPESTVYDLEGKPALVMYVKTAQSVLAAWPDKFTKRKINMNARAGKRRAGQTFVWSTTVKPAFLTPKADPGADDVAKIDTFGSPIMNTLGAAPSIPPQPVLSVADASGKPVDHIPANNAKPASLPPKGVDYFTLGEPELIGKLPERRDLPIMPAIDVQAEPPIRTTNLSARNVRSTPELETLLAALSKESGEPISVCADHAFAKGVKAMHAAVKDRLAAFEIARQNAAREAMLR